MLPPHKRRQIPRTIFSYICDIARPSHLLYGTEGFYEISELGADAITIDAHTFNCHGYDGIQRHASMTDFLL
jgi:hypothetical protein